MTLGTRRFVHAVGSVVFAAGVAFSVQAGSHYAVPESEKPATVVTGIVPSDAEVFLDGESVGFASDYDGRWDELSVPGGKHGIGFRHEGYRSLVLDLDVLPGETYVLNDRLASGAGDDHRSPTAAAPRPEGGNEQASRIQATGRLRLHVEPDDAAVYLDGAYLGLAVELSSLHAALAVATGAHRLEAVRPGYASVVRTIEVEETGVSATELTLEPVH